MSMLSAKFLSVGHIGEVYVTWCGIDLADPYTHPRGWRQVTVLERELVVSRDVMQTHDRWLDWFSPEELEPWRRDFEKTIIKAECPFHLISFSE